MIGVLVVGVAVFAFVAIRSEQLPKRHLHDPFVQDLPPAFATIFRERTVFAEGTSFSEPWQDIIPGMISYTLKRNCRQLSLVDTTEIH